MALTQYDCILIKSGKVDRLSGEMLCEDRDADGRQSWDIKAGGGAISQGTPRPIRSQKRQESVPQRLQNEPTSQHLIRHSDSRTVKEYIFLILSHLVCG